MRRVQIGGDILRDINCVVLWLDESGYPTLSRYENHWSGSKWRIDQQRRERSLYPLYCIEIEDPDLMAMFLRRWG